MKRRFFLRVRSGGSEDALPRRLVLPVAFAVLMCCAQAVCSELSPVGSIGRFFDFLVKQQVKEAAHLAVFSDDQAHGRFIVQWTEDSPYIRDYKIEEWDIEPRTGFAEVALSFGDPARDRSLKVGLVKLDGAWRVAPQGDPKLTPSARSSPQPIENIEELVDVSSETKGDRVEVVAVNKAPCSVLFRFDADLPAALRPDPPLPILAILPPTKKPVHVCDLRIVTQSSYRYSLRYSVRRADDSGDMVRPDVLTVVPGVPIADDARFFARGKYAYGLPYPTGKSYVVWQGPGGEFSHSEGGSRYAVDFSLPLDSEIAAARNGVVIAVVQKNPDNEDDNPAPKSMANEILILHADSTIGVYAHLTTNGAKASFGQVVRRGDVIGLSGNSGYSRGPHLHFEVLAYDGGQSGSVPFDFYSLDGGTIPPREGFILIAEPSGAAGITKTETTPWRILHKRYDEYETELRYFAKTIQFLAVNATSDPLGIELSFSKLENVVSATDLPRKVALPADGALHHVLTLELAQPGQKASFSYLFRRVESPGREHISLRVEREPADGYVVEIRYFSDRIEFYAENKSSGPIAGLLDFPSMKNLTPKEKMPLTILLAADGSPHYLATLRMNDPTKGYSFQYSIGPSDKN